jgi:hypothetical protein
LAAEKSNSRIRRSLPGLKLIATMQQQSLGRPSLDAG